jgi:hypothetical protein
MPIIDLDSGFQQNRQFYAENNSKSPKIVILTLTPKET